MAKSKDSKKKVYGRKCPDVHGMHVTKDDIKFGKAGDQQHCAMARTEFAKIHNMSFSVDTDAMHPRVRATWSVTENGKRIHHQAEVAYMDGDLEDKWSVPQAVIVAVDTGKKRMLKTFPEEGLDFVLTNHTARPAGHSRYAPVNGETEEARAERRGKARLAKLKLKEARDKGESPPAKKRNRRIRARFSK